MGTPIYKITEYVNWKGTSPIFSGASAGGGVVIPEPAGGGLDGSGAAGQIAFWLDNNTVVGDEGLTYEVDSSGNGILTLSHITGIGDSAEENTELFIYSDNLYFGDGDIGCLPAGVTGSNVMFYDPLTGKLSYGEVIETGGVSLSGSTNMLLLR
jgi:hypothetical protein